MKKSNSFKPAPIPADPSWVANIYAMANVAPVSTDGFILLVRKSVAVHLFAVTGN